MSGERDPARDLGALVRAVRGKRSLAELADLVHYHRGFIGNVETGKRFPPREFAVAVDRELRTGGVLTRAWIDANEIRQEQGKQRHLLEAAVKDSKALLSFVEPSADIDAIQGGVQRLAVEYLGTPATPILEDAVTMRQEVMSRIKSGDYRPNDARDLYLATGRLSGVLSYAALDLGAPNAALEHTAAAWHCADAIGDDELRAWVRGTQSLILRFENRYEEALSAARDGQRYAKRGTSAIRLLCGEAQCLANLGNSRAANSTLDRALTAREHIKGNDALGGLFEFSEAKQHYYAGSSLIWLDGGADAERAAREAEQAILLWEDEPVERRSLDDEALAHIYLSTARLQLHDLEGAMEAVRPILELPADRRISWIDRRLGRLADLLTLPPYDRSPAAKNAHCELLTYDTAGTDS